MAAALLQRFTPHPPPPTASAANCNPIAAAEHVKHVITYIKQAYPFWNRTQGRDHMFWMTGDKGACYIQPGEEAENPIKLVHFGFSPRNYSGPLE
jgi:hypothetical protein